MRKSDDVLPLDYLATTAEYHRQVWHVLIPKRFGWNDVTDPAFWVHQNRIQVNDILEIMAEDGSFEARARVLQTGPRGGGFAVLRILSEFHAPKAAAQTEATGIATIGFSPVEGAWLLFGGDGTPRSKFASEESAATALAEYLAIHPLEAPLPEAA
jgi:hypothetical protein